MAMLTVMVMPLIMHLECSIADVMLIQAVEIMFI